MRTTLLLLATALLPALTAVQGQERRLSYRGWALGISLDSAKALTKAQIARPVAIYNPARQIRLMQQRADSSRNQR